MNVDGARHPAASLPGAMAIATWSAYWLAAALYFLPDVPPSALVIALGGLLACSAVAFRFQYWRWVVTLAAVVYLSFYAVRIGRMIGLTANPDWSSLLTSLSFYYGSSWRVTVGMLEERGAAGALMHGFLEYAMPVLSLVLIIVSLALGKAARSGNSQ